MASADPAAAPAAAEDKAKPIMCPVCGIECKEKRLGSFEGYVNKRECDMCKQEIDRKEPRWHCGENCDVDICMECTATPYLNGYFGAKMAAADEAIKDALAFGGGPAGTIQEKMDKVAEMIAKAEKKKSETSVELKRLLGLSFDRHDTKGNGILDREEAIVFFGKFFTQHADFTEHASADAIRMSLEASAKQIKSMGMPKEALDMPRNLVENMVKELLATIKKSEEDYTLNKKDRDEAAFKVMDKNEDGTVVKDDFVNIVAGDFGGDAAKNAEFLQALGFPINSVVPEVTGPQVIQVQPEDCKTQ